MAASARPASVTFGISRIRIAGIVLSGLRLEIRVSEMSAGRSGPRKTESGRAGKDHDPFALQVHLDIFRLMKFCPHHNGKRIDCTNCSSGACSSGLN